MAKQPASRRSSSMGMTVEVKSPSRSSKVTTKLGEVTVRGSKPSRELVEANVTRSSRALERVSNRLMKPGVHLPERKGVPRFYSDENHPGVFVRRLNGKITTGRLEDGQFVESQ